MPVAWFQSSPSPSRGRYRAILLSHQGHYDPTSGRSRLLPSITPEPHYQVVATAKTLEILSSHLIDGIVYREFTSKDSFLGKATIKLVPLEPLKRKDIEGYQVIAVPVPHPLDGVGFEITSRDGKALFYTGDTGPGLSSIWSNISPQLIIAEVTWPNRLAGMAREAAHLCPDMFREELLEFRRTKGYLPKVVVIHMSPQHETEMKREIREVAELLGISIDIPREGDELVL